MFDFNKPKIEIAEISNDKKYGRFVVEPLERGYGTTLGNSLRRIMLSSLPGAAVSQVKIEGVLHEFSSIPGVKEDVTEIIMNINLLTGYHFHIEGPLVCCTHTHIISFINCTVTMKQITLSNLNQVYVTIVKLVN